VSRDPLEPVLETVELADGRKVYRYSFPGTGQDAQAQVSLTGDNDAAPRVEEAE
jgi:hypothetical protein